MFEDNIESKLRIANTTDSNVIKYIIFSHVNKRCQRNGAQGQLNLLSQASGQTVNPTTTVTQESLSSL